MMKVKTKKYHARSITAQYNSQMLYNHVLMIGTTGMLSTATYGLALKTNTLTCVARTQQSLKVIEGGLDRHGPTFFPVQVDYINSELFMHEVKMAWKKRPFDLVVAWLHSNGSVSFNQLLAFLSQQEHKTDFYHIVGSAAADPSAQHTQISPQIEGGLRYHQVILGFQIESDNRSRWLHHGEINSGVLQAIQSSRPKTIIGTVEPWSARP
ncbi:MAG: hypothetical protein ACI85U_002206 [Candidatus Promineifilaceae bacterium]|jgi:hypothetical protein